MENLFDKLIKKRRNLIVEIEDLTGVLIVLNHHHIYEVTLGNCGWKSETKWYVNFNSSDEKWDGIKAELTKGDFNDILTYTKCYKKL